MIRQIQTILILLIPLSSFATVNMRNANYSETLTDLIVPGSGFDLRIQRSYNSRTLHNGIFGFGWCSDFETTLQVTAEGNLLLTECGGGREVTYAPKDFDPKMIKNSIEKMITEVQKRNPKLNADYIKNLRVQLTNEKFFREELARQLEMEGDVTAGQKYYPDGRQNEFIVLKGNEYTRQKADGTYEKFDKLGKLTFIFDRNRNYLKIRHHNGLIASVIDNNGRQLLFKYDEKNKKATEVIGPNGLKTAYKYNGEDLSYVKNAWNNEYHFTYDDLHNLVAAKFPDGTAKKISYNKDKDWVTSFTNRKGCSEKYDYDQDKDDPLNHYWASVVKTCGKKVVNRSKFEFYHRVLAANDQRYLYRTRTEINGQTSDVIYHETFGLPVSVVRNRTKVQYHYYPTGQVKAKVEPFRTTDFHYKGECEKVTHVVVKYFQPAPPEDTRKTASNKANAVSMTNVSKDGKILSKTIKTDFQYQPKKCNLIFAKNSDGQAVKLSYDQRGRINKILDQSKKLVLIEYEERFGKPSKVKRPGLGTISIAYKRDGQIDKVDSPDGATIAVQVASVFNNLLDIIAPATSEVSI